MALGEGGAEGITWKTVPGSEAWNMHGMCEEYAWNMNVICMVYVWNSMENAQNRY